MLCNAADSVLVVIDLQPSFLAPMPDAESVLARNRFLIRCARLLEVPILVTEQYATRMGGTDPSLLPLLEGVQVYDKMAFSAMGHPSFVRGLGELGRRQVILTGIETHICVMQTALHLLEQDYSVFAAHDCITGRGDSAPALARMRHAGASVVHSESLVYEWMQGAEHPAFRDVLKVVKEG